MKFTDVLPYDNKIVNGVTNYFISNEDFEFNGIPILKDSLVIYDHNIGEVYINQLPYYGLGKTILNKLSNTEDGFTVKVDKVSNNNNEQLEFPSEYELYWNKDHFEGLVDYSNQVDLAKNAETLNYNKIKFSSAAYTFDIDSLELTNFIAVEEYIIDCKELIIAMPPFTLISKHIFKNKSCRYDLKYLSSESFSFKGFEISRLSEINNEYEFKFKFEIDTQVKLLNHPKYENLLCQRKVNDIFYNSEGDFLILLYEFDKDGNVNGSKKYKFIKG